MKTLFWGYVRTPEEKRDYKAMNDAHEELKPSFRSLNNHLADKDYVAGSSFTMGDIPMGK